MTQFQRIKAAASKSAIAIYNAAIDAGEDEEEANEKADSAYQDYIEGWGDQEYDRLKERSL